MTVVRIPTGRGTRFRKLRGAPPPPVAGCRQGAVATVWARLANLPPSLDWIALAVVVAIWSAAFFLLGVLVVTLAFPEVSVDAILASPALRAPSYAPPTYAPLAPTRAAPPGRVLVLPGPRAPAK